MNFAGVIHLNKTGICVLCGLLLILFLYSISNKNDINDESNAAKINLHELLNVAIRAAENGGKEIILTKDNITIKSKGLTKEGLVDSVTTADYLSHCSMVRTLKHFYPSLNVISEEAKTICDQNQLVDFSLYKMYAKNVADEYVENKDVTIWIDPLDATKEYTEKLYNYVTVMVCVAVKGKPLIGVIHKPFLKGTSWAWVDKAKSEDLDVQIQEDNDDNLKIIISRSHHGKIEGVLQKNINKKIKVISAAGAGYKALEVATGNADAYLHITAIKKWDICAGNAVINALGGKMTTKYNTEIDYSGGNNINVKNEEGLIATIKNHDFFLGKL